MAITTRFLTGFEYGSSSLTNGGGLLDTVAGPASISFITGGGRFPGRRMRLTVPANTATHARKNAAGAPTKVVARFAVLVVTHPTSATAQIAHCQNSGGTTIVTLNVSSTGALSAQFGTGTSQTGPTIDTTSWYLIELQIDAVAGTLDWKVNTVEQTQATGPASTNINSMAIGTASTVQPAFTADYDDWIFGSWTNATTDWYGDGRVIAQPAGADGTHATITSLSPGDAGTAYTGTPTTVYTMVDDFPAATGWDGTTRSTTDSIALRTATVTAYAEIQPTVTTQTGQANAVRAVMSYSSSTTTANRAACDVRNSAGTVTELWGLTGGVGQSYALTTNQFKGALVTPPAAGWTAAEVNAIRFRFGGCTSADISPVPTVQAMMLEVDWPISTGPTAYPRTASDTWTITDTADAVVTAIAAETIPVLLMAPYRGV